MKELTEIRFNDNRILLKENLVRTPILPKLSSELDRDVVVQGDCIVEGAVFARNLTIQQGPLRVKGPVFAQVELHVNTDAKGAVFFEKAACSANAIVSLAPGCRMHFLADVSAKQVKLRNAYVSASIFADEIVLEDCVVIGGAFATRSLELHNCVVGTFNSPTVRASHMVYLLFPSAFSVENLSSLPGTEFFNLTLADLGALMRGTPQAENSGKIGINTTQDEVKVVLVGDGTQQILRTYSVVGKVLAADLVDYDKLQNHFLLSCASLGSQLLRTYDLGLDKAGNVVELTPERVAEFFFDILHGKIEVTDLAGDFDINTIVHGLGSTPTEQETTSQESAATKAPVPTTPTVEAPVPVAPPAETSVSTPSAEAPTSTAPGVCRHCGAELEEGSSFCGNCGKSQE
jgi:hypothetical protein